MVCTQPFGERTLMPSPLSSQTNSTGMRRPVWSYQPAVLNAAVALAWLTEASPNEQTTIASAGQGAGDAPPPPGSWPSPVRRPDVSSRRSRSTARPMPTARGRCEAMVEVVGTTARSARPNTLCRPPAIGSRLEATMPRSTSRAASAYPGASADATGPAVSLSSPAGGSGGVSASPVAAGSRGSGAASATEAAAGSRGSGAASAAVAGESAPDAVAWAARTQ
ncbi:hypothetical protein JD76_00330 [Micromonospora endolithica]|nr:hypothetical protein JD76_00330 [Micromonospora endolithica]